MKKLTYLIGLISSLIITVGETFLLLHLPGANKLFLIGFFMLLFVFVPLLIVDKYKGASRILRERLQLILGGISSVIVGFSGVFKIMHLQGADVLLIIGALVFAVGFLPLYFYAMYRKSIN